MQNSLSKPVRIALIIFAALIIIGAAFYFLLKKHVTLVINGHSNTYTTYALTVGSLLNTRGIPLSPDDSLSPSQDAWLKNGMQINLVRAIPVQILKDENLISAISSIRQTSELLNLPNANPFPNGQVLSNAQPIDINQSFPLDTSSITLQFLRPISYTLAVDGQAHVYTSTAQTLGAALWTAGVQLFAADKLTPPLNTPLTSGLAATLSRSHQVTIQTLDGPITFRTAAKTVGEALAEANLALQGLDYSLPAPEQPVPASGVMQLVRVTEDVLVEQSPLPFETQYQPVDTLEIDSQSIVQDGEYGLNAQRIRVRYEDGQEITRTVESEWVAKQPVPRILGYGTQVTMKTEVVDGVTIQYWRKLNMYATSYHPSEVGNTTASGLPLKKGVAAIDRSIIPFFTQMYIPGYGEAVAADTGGGVIGRWIDLGYSDSDYVPWHQWVTVYLLWPPPASIVWVIP